MKTSISLRNKMLETVSTSLETPVITPTWDRYIEFQSSDSTALCRILYETLVESYGIGENASYIFVAPDGTNILRGMVDIASGVVSKFLITGDTGDTINGSVGSLSSNSDLKFNRINWTVNVTSITISNLELVIPQGT